MEFEIRLSKDADLVARLYDKRNEVLKTLEDERKKPYILQRSALIHALGDERRLESVSQQFSGYFMGRA